MKLRKPCEHDHYEEHPCIDGKWVSQMRMLRITDEERALLSMCPGGVFLPDDTLVIERDTDGAWPQWVILAVLAECGSIRLLNALSVREAPEVDKNQLEVPFKNDRGAW